MEESKVITDISYLPKISDLGNVNSNLIQINSARSIGQTNPSTKSDNWLAGVMDFSFSVSDQQRLSMSRSYCRAEVEVSVSDGATPPYF